MLRIPITFGILLITFAYCQEINEIPEPPEELKSIPPPPEAVENDIIFSGEERSINKTAKPSAVQACDDSSEYCSYWQQNWGCSYGSVGTNCRKTCNLCGTGTCTDSSEDPWRQYCSTWKSYCSSHTGVRANCKKTCNLCDGDGGSINCPANPTRYPTSANPPYSGTIFNFPGVITASDPTSFTGLRYAGQGSRLMFDGRYGGRWITVNAWLFTASYSDHSSVEFRCNPEFSYSDAYAQASKFANALGRIPEVFRSRVDIFDLNRGSSAQGGRGGGGFDRRSMSLNTDYGTEMEGKGILEELFIHEGSHASLDGYHANAREWICAENDDRKFISTYSRDNPGREDVAESALPWLAVRYRSNRINQNDVNTIRSTIPNRMAYFDRKISIRFPQ